MRTREELRRQLTVAGELRLVVTTMKGLAAATIHPFEQTLAALDDYLSTVELGLQVAMASDPISPPAAARRRGQALLVLGSDHGLCGALNRLVAEQARRVADRDGDGPEPNVLVIGERMASELEIQHLHPAHRWRAPASAPAITELVEALLPTVERVAREVQRVVLVLPQPTASPGRYVPTAQQVLPLDAERLRRLAKQPWPSRRLPQVVGDAAAVRLSLTRTLVAVDLHRAVAQSAVAVHGSRLAAMQAAERNIDERLEDLQRSYHQVRQAILTDELLDVVSGFETLRGR
jgi:F-type H+-transporting ATPase subunit gamma